MILKDLKICDIVTFSHETPCDKLHYFLELILTD